METVHQPDPSAAGGAVRLGEEPGVRVQRRGLRAGECLRVDVLGAARRGTGRARPPPFQVALDSARPLLPHWVPPTPQGILQMIKSGVHTVLYLECEGVLFPHHLVARR